MKQCELCNRQVPKTSRHHLIPRTLHGNKWFRKRFSREEMQETLALCRDCHRQIHVFIPEKEMGRHYNSREKLLSHPQVAGFIAWLTR